MMEEAPEVKFAKKLVNRYKLIPPIDIFSLTKKYAVVEIATLPLDVDGISLHLKTPNKKPLIILNNDVSSTRMRFTLAHELGHIIIPWHIGNIIDTLTDKDIQKTTGEYRLEESEANKFASELLMPTDWLREEILNEGDPTSMISKLVHEADVSPHAATIKLISLLNPGYIFVALSDDNEVIHSGRSEGTLATSPEWHTTIDPDTLYPYGSQKYYILLNDVRYYWWHISKEINVMNDNDPRSWRELLDQICLDIEVPLKSQIKFKMTVNGIIAYANSRVTGDARTIGALYSACLQRIYSKNEAYLIPLRKHKEFDLFLRKRVQDLMDRVSKD